MRDLVLPALIGLTVAFLGLALAMFLADLARQRDIASRIGQSQLEATRQRLLSRSERYRPAWQKWVQQIVPPSWLEENTEIHETLLHAGYDTPVQAIIYVAIRLACLTLTPLLVFIFMLFFFPQLGFSKALGSAVAAGIVGFLVPLYVLRYMAAARRKRIRRSLPDGIDLIIVCVEAGIGLSAAVLRVAHEMADVYPDLSTEFLIVNQKTNAGLSREDAFKGMWKRTGVDEVRVMVASLVQGEKWGSSIAQVLRAASETFRRERQQAAEKAAATAPTKMTLPLALLIFPALMAIIMGPAVIMIIEGMGDMGGK